MELTDRHTVWQRQCRWSDRWRDKIFHPFLLRIFNFLSWKQFAEKINTRILPNLYFVTSTKPCVYYLLIYRERNRYISFFSLTFNFISLCGQWLYLGFPNFESTLEYWKYVYTKLNQKNKFWQFSIDKQMNRIIKNILICIPVMSLKKAL